MRYVMAIVRRILVVVMLACCSMAVQAQSSATADDRKGVQFAWGASFTGQVDLTGRDMSSAGMDAYFGMKTSAIEVFGIGVGLNVPVSNSRRTMPIYAIVRTNFTTRPTLCFMDVRGGISVNDYDDDYTKVGAYMSGGIGINLATGRRFSSHIIVGFAYYDRKMYKVGDVEHRPGNLGMATLRLGVSF